MNSRFQKLYVDFPTIYSGKVIVKNNDKLDEERSYLRLLKALLNILKSNFPQQLEQIIHHTRNGTVIIFSEVCDLFESTGETDKMVDYNNAHEQKDIVYDYYIINKHDSHICPETYMIGSKCINNWNPSEAGRLKREQSIKKDPNISYCGLCNRKNDKKSCSCPKIVIKSMLSKAFLKLAKTIILRKRESMLINKKIMKTKRKIFHVFKKIIILRKREAMLINIKIMKTKRKIFYIFKNNAYNNGRLTRINFGKYRNVFTYFELWFSDNKIIEDYMKWIENDMQDNQNKRSIMSYKNNIINNEHSIDPDFEEKIQRKLDNLWYRKTLKWTRSCCECGEILMEMEEVFMKLINNKWEAKCLDC